MSVKTGTIKGNPPETLKAAICCMSCEHGDVTEVDGDEWWCEFHKFETEPDWVCDDWFSNIKDRSKK